MFIFIFKILILSMLNKDLNISLNKTYFNNNKIQITNLINPIENKNYIKIVGETKHTINANKEWNNSIYCYNTDKSLISKYKLLNKFLKSYFNIESFFKLRNLSKYSDSRAKSIRRKMLGYRKSLNQILLSKPDIKQTNDKLIITIYTYNTRKQYLLKKIYLSNRLNKKKFNSMSVAKLYFLANTYLKNKSHKLLKINSNYLSNNILYNKYKKNTLSRYIVDKTNIKLKYFKKLSSIYITNIMKYRYKNIYKYRHKNKYRNIYKKIRRDIYKNLYNNRYLKFIKPNTFNNKYKNYSNRILLYKRKFIISVIKKKTFVKAMFFFSFLKWILSLIHIKVELTPKRRKRTMLLIKGETIRRFFFKRSYSHLYILQKTNRMLLRIFKVSLKNNNNININIYSFFKLFKIKYSEKFLIYYFNKNRLKMNNLYMFSLNNFKFEKLMSVLKVIINKIYNKKVLFNIVNLKHLYLNNDILVKSIALKLKRKKGKLLKTLKKSIRLVKLVNEESSNLKNLSNNILLHNYKDNKLNSLNYNLNKKKKDTVNQTLYNIFKYQFSYLKHYNKKFNDVKSNRINILNSINYKWIKGIKLEGTGRLTKRYTASKTIYKYKYRGSLKNNNILLQNMLRGDLKSNLQYGFIPSKRRIGAFGIKGWISTI